MKATPFNQKTIAELQAKKGSGVGTSNGRLAVYCGTQVRSWLTASVLRRHGHDATVVMGGLTDWLDHGYAVERQP